MAKRRDSRPWCAYVCIFGAFVIGLEMILSSRLKRAQLPRPTAKDVANHHIDHAVARAETFQNKVVGRPESMRTVQAGGGAVAEVQLGEQQQQQQQQQRGQPPQQQPEEEEKLQEQPKEEAKEGEEEEETPEEEDDDPSAYAQKAYQVINGEREDRQAAYDRVMAKPPGPERRKEYLQIEKEQQARDDANEKVAQAALDGGGALMEFSADACKGELTLDEISKDQELTKCSKGAGVKITVSCEAGVATFVRWKDDACEYEAATPARLNAANYEQLKDGKCANSMGGLISYKGSNLQLPDCGKGSFNGVEACERHGYSEKECDAVGCCQFNHQDLSCVTAVGKEACVADESAGEEESPTKWAAAAYQVVSTNDARQSAYDRVMGVTQERRKAEYDKIVEEVEAGDL